MLYSEKALHDELKVQLDKFDSYLKQLRTNRAKPEIFENVFVNAYGSSMEIKSLAAVAVKHDENGTSVVIRPYDPGIVKNIVEGIEKSPLSLNPTDEGDHVRINLPPLTQEVREETVKEMHQELEEQYKKHVRLIRQDYIQSIDKMDGVSEDDQELSRKAVQRQIDQTMEALDNAAKAKQAEIMTI